MANKVTVTQNSLKPTAVKDLRTGELFLYDTRLGIRANINGVPYGILLDFGTYLEGSYIVVRVPFGTVFTVVAE